MSFLRRRKVLGTAITVGVVALAGAAYAYFTASGSGTGSATVGNSTALTLHATTSPALFPGSTATVTFKADNSSGGKERVGTIHLASVVACDQAFSGTTCGGNEITTCESVEPGASNTNTANFYMPDVVANQEVAAGTNQSITATGTLTMNDLSTSQDSCKNAFLLLNFTS